MQPPLEVLVLPGGTELGLEVRQALESAAGVRLHSAGQPGSSHAPFVFERHVPLPSVHAEGWLPALREFVEANGIDYIYPAHDDVGLALAEHAGELGAGVVTSPVETCRIARSKRATYALLAEAVPVPSITSDRITPDRITSDPGAPVHFPVFVKPDRGQGSRGARSARNASELAIALASVREPLVMQYLPGREFTVDCFSDRERGLLFCGGRERLRTRNGIARHTATCSDPRFQEYAARIGERLAFHGAWFYQVREDAAGELVLLEVAPRIAGGSGLQRARGVNLPRLALDEQERRPVEPRVCAWDVELSRALGSCLRLNVHVDEVCVALEGTLVQGSRINALLVAYLLDARARGSRLVLMTADLDVAAAVLAEHRLPELFDAHRLHGVFAGGGARTLLIDDDGTRRASAHMDASADVSALDSSIAGALMNRRT